MDNTSTNVPIPEEVKELQKKFEEVMEKAKKFNLNNYMVKLLMEEPFFSAFSMYIDKQACWSIPTAAMGINKETAQFVLMYNPAFMVQLSNKHKLGIIKHEFYHMIFEHITGRLPPEGMSQYWNFATDLAINSNIPNEIPEWALLPGRKPFEKLPLCKSSEWYFSALQKEPFKSEMEKMIQQQQQGGEGEGQAPDLTGGKIGPGRIDDHSTWAEVDETTRDIAKQRLKQAARKAANEAAQSNNWGNMSAECREAIMSLIKTHVNWQAILRYFIKTSQRASRRSTIRRLNKRYPYIHPGSKVTRLANIAISIDQSGSVDDQTLAIFFAELNSLANLATFTVIPFDHEVAIDKVYVWKKGTHKTVERVRCGGTNFDAPTSYVNRENFDGHIILTDLKAPKPGPSKCQRMWMTTAEHAERPYFQTNERIVVIETKD